MSKVYILPYLRKGLATNLTGPDRIVSGQQRARIDVSLGFDLKQAADDKMVHRTLKGRTIELLGPADIQTLKARAIARRSPAAGGGTQLNRAYMPYVEMYEEDLPWRYTPLSPTHRDFHPWMALIAVKTDEVEITVSGGSKVAELHLTPERFAEVFPTTGQLARVGHVQIDVSHPDLERLLSQPTLNAPEVEARVGAMLDENPDCGMSRILCTSRLEASTRYVALLIPSYELGRRAGLGMPTDGVGLADRAWGDRHDGGALCFPVYDRWTFETAVADDNFNTLADRLCFTSDEEYAAMKAYLDVDISDCGLPTYSFRDEEVIDVPAALIMDPTAAMPDKVRKEDERQFTPRLQEHLALNPVFDENASGGIVADEDPWVVPPIYGARHMLTKRDEFCGSKGYNLVADVNLRLRNRIAAGMGASVVKANQEQFVNRAWKKVEVVNALNQMLREYYQMQEVNQRAADKNVRGTVRGARTRVTTQTEGLLYDAALRMLQTSGIYYNNVAPDTMLAEAVKMKDAPLPTAMRGIPASYLQGIYDINMWENDIIRKELLYDRVHDDAVSLAWDSEVFEDWDFLSTYFGIHWGDDRRPYFHSPDLNNSLVITPKTLISSRIRDFFALRDIMKKRDHMDCNEAYNALTFLRELYPVFDDAHCAQRVDFCRKTGTSLRDYTLRIYPIRAAVSGMGSGHAFIVSDEGFSALHGTTKPLAVEYYVGPKKTAVARQYLIFIPKSYLAQCRPQYTIQRTPEFLNMPIPVHEVGGRWDMSTMSMPSIGTDYGRETWLYNQIKMQRDWHVNHSNVWEKQGSKSDKKYESKNEKPCLQIQYEGTKFETSLKGTEHQWLRWVGNDPLSKRFWNWTESTKTFRLYSFRYVEVLNEMLQMIDSIYDLIYQPTDVALSLNLNQCHILRAEDLYDRAMASNTEVSTGGAEINAIREAVKREAAKVSAALKTPLPNEPVEDTTVALNLPDPDTLGRQRIEELCRTYGVTEANQLKLTERLHTRYPVMVYPDFLDPTFYYLRELSTDYVLPATGSLLKNSVSCFYSNPAFEEAFLLGMNTEMGRELLWREYPTDQRGSYFRKFWDQTSLPDKEKLDTEWYDVRHLDLWTAKKSNGNPAKLGENHLAGKGQMLVFAIKGELMQAFPDTDIYLQTRDGRTTLEPTMNSWLTDDTCLVGFQGVTREKLPQYMLVFRQKPLSLQFCMDSPELGGLCRIVRPCCYRVPAGEVTVRN